ncbi:MAG: GGDEF domain-containing protein [Lachnospiraceae bacterium]|nr:GGDEF domain-containing protein [Lachnospiraceae bacterium]
MDFKDEIIEFVSDKIGGVVIIACGSDEIMYADSFFTNKYRTDIVGMDASEIFLWLDDCPALSVGGDIVEWENIDTDSKKYYRFQSAMFEKEGRNYVIHMISDITEYMGLNRDITKYMAFFQKLSAFQTAVLEKLSDTYYELLPLLTDYFKTSKAFYFIQRDDKVDIITFNKMGNIYSNDRIDMTEDVANAFFVDEEDEIPLDRFSAKVQEVMLLNGSARDSKFRKLCDGSVSGQKYAVYLNVWPNMNTDLMQEKMLLGVIKLFVENGIIKDKLIYNSEHDGLTGLYNKAKLLDMKETEYIGLNSIGIFNLDVNNLKKMNDEFGHEAGDKLLIKAANSIRKVTNNKVHGYRMGGDEFLLIACDITKEELDSIKVRWERELARLNAIDDEINCVIAAGVVFWEAGYDFDALMKEADALMYEDKKAKKKPGEEIR